MPDLLATLKKTLDTPIPPMQESVRPAPHNPTPVEQRLLQKAQEHVADKLKAPVTWSHKSRAPYYTEHHAKEIKLAIDGMMRDRKPRIWYYEKFPLAPATLKNKISQAKQYLIDYLDTPNRDYKQFLECVHMHTRKGVGIILSIAQENLDEKIDHGFMPDVMKDEGKKWREKVEWFIENAPMGDRLHLHGLALTDEDLTKLYEEFGQVQSLLLTAGHHELIIQKLVL